MDVLSNVRKTPLGEEIIQLVNNNEGGKLSCGGKEYTSDDLIKSLLDDDIEGKLRIDWNTVQFSDAFIWSKTSLKSDLWLYCHDLQNN